VENTPIAKGLEQPETDEDEPNENKEVKKEAKREVKPGDIYTLGKALQPQNSKPQPPWWPRVAFLVRNFHSTFFLQSDFTIA
jgi:hypothetical protein